MSITTENFNNYAGNRTEFRIVYLLSPIIQVLTLSQCAKCHRWGLEI